MLRVVASPTRQSSQIFSSYSGSTKCPEFITYATANPSKINIRTCLFNSQGDTAPCVRLANRFSGSFFQKFAAMEIRLFIRRFLMHVLPRGFTTDCWPAATAPLQALMAAQGRSHPAAAIIRRD